MPKKFKSTRRPKNRPDPENGNNGNNANNGEDEVPCPQEPGTCAITEIVRERISVGDAVYLIFKPESGITPFSGFVTRLDFDHTYIGVRDASGVSYFPVGSLALIERLNDPPTSTRNGDNGGKRYKK